MTAANNPTPTVPAAAGLDVAKLRLTLHCLRCRSVLGEQLGPRKIRLGGVEIRQRIVAYCRVCQRRWKWRPGEEESSGT